MSRGGGRCHGIALIGADTCRIHCGVRPELAKAKGEAVQAWSVVSGGASLTPADAVMGMLTMTWARVHIYAGLLEEQVLKAQGVDEDDGEGDSDHEWRRGASSVGEGAGLIGHTFSAVKDIGVYASGEAIRGLVQLEQAERDRVVKYAKTAHDMGIADRQIQLAEQQGTLLAGAVKEILAALNLSVEQQELVPQIVPAVLRAVMAGEDAA